MRLKIFLNIFIVTALLGSVSFLGGCKDSVTEPGDITGDYEAQLKLVSEDEAISSFDANYNEEDLMSFGKVSSEIYPFRVGHRISMVSREMTTEIAGDTTYGTVTTTFEGTLLISASYTEGASSPDTVIQKPFTSVVKRKVIFVQRDSIANRERTWKIAAISLPEGGTAGANINITRLTIIPENGDEIVVTSPNEYFLFREENPGGGRRGHHRFRRGFIGDMPSLNAGEDVTIRVELTSAYSDSDFVSLTWGAKKGVPVYRTKRKFVLVSSTPAGGAYVKVYEQTYRANPLPGFFHAVINAYPRQVIYDDATPVENKVWGVPYLVR